MPRIEFPEKTKSAVAGRSGYRCSIPDCRRLTIGPGAGPTDVVKSGIAAHVFSASSAGPRGQGYLTEDELADAENAIWLCSDHAHIVDSRGGAGYSPATLLSLKHLSEARAAREQGSSHAPFYWLQELTLRATPINSPGQKIQLGRVNLVIGDNAGGKTALCEWLAAFVNLEWLSRWRSSFDPTAHTSLELRYYAPEPHLASLATGKDQAVTFSIDGQPVPLIALPVRVVFPQRIAEGRRRGALDDLGAIAQALALDPAICLNLTAEMQNSPDTSLRNVRFERDADGTWLHLDSKNAIPNDSLDTLSGSELARLVIEFAIAASRVLGRSQATLLVLDGHLAFLGQDGFRHVCSRLTNAQNLFQVVATVPKASFDTATLRSLGLEVVRTTGISPNIAIDQGQ